MKYALTLIVLALTCGVVPMTFAQMTSGQYETQQAFYACGAACQYDNLSTDNHPEFNLWVSFKHVVGSAEPRIINVSEFVGLGTPFVVRQVRLSPYGSMESYFVFGQSTIVDTDTFPERAEVRYIVGLKRFDGTYQAKAKQTFVESVPTGAAIGWHMETTSVGSEPACVQWRGDVCMLTSTSGAPSRYILLATGLFPQTGTVWVRALAKDGTESGWVSATITQDGKTLTVKFPRWTTKATVVDVTICYPDGTFETILGAWQNDAFGGGGLRGE